MSKIVKEYSRREADGYAEERKCERHKDNSISLEIKHEVCLTPFAMDRFKKNYVVFAVHRKSYNVYIWVLINDKYYEPKIKLLTIQNLLDWTGAEFNVKGPFPEEAITEALNIINSADSFELISTIQRFCEETNAMPLRSLEKDDRAFLEAVKRARTENKGIFQV